MEVLPDISAKGLIASSLDRLEDEISASLDLQGFLPRAPTADGLSIDDESGGEASSTFDSRSPQSSAASSVPPRAEEWDRTLRHTGLEDFGKALATAARTVYSNNKSRYSQVFVLLICWQTQDPALPVEREITGLRKVLEDIYQYSIDEFLIPDSDSHAAVSEKINAFVKVNNNSSSDLKIVYYAGHSRLSRTKELIWSTLPEKKHTKYPTVMWSGIQRSLEMANSDVLILLDCCSSGVANASEGNGVTELICACPFDTKANGVGDYSFTQALTTELRLLSKKPCFSVGELCTTIYTRIQSYLEQGIENERYPPPVHFVITQDEPFIRGIKLSIQDTINLDQDNTQRGPSKRVRFKDADSLKEPWENESPHFPNKRCRSDDASSFRIEEVVLPWVDSPETQKDEGGHAQTFGPSQEGQSCPKLEATHQGESPKDEVRRCSPKDSLYPLDAPRALFAVRFKEDIRGEDLSVKSFKEWLQSIPAAVEEVCVEAGFKCFSTLLLITMPLSMCSYIPQHPAIFPLGAVKSSMMLSSERRNNHSFQHHDDNPFAFQKRVEGKGTVVCSAEDDEQFASGERAVYSDTELDGSIKANSNEVRKYLDEVVDHSPQSPDKNYQDIADFQVSESAVIYVRNILDKFPSADIKLAERLGDTNWRRHVMIRNRNEMSEINNEVPGEAARSVFQPISVFHDSGLGSSIPPTSCYAASLSSFLSRAGDADSKYFRVPQTPKQAFDGLPFECFICGRIINHVKNRIDWKMHVFTDIRPYICTFSPCKDALYTFATRDDWAEHEFKYHLGRTSWPCPKCPMTLDNTDGLQRHLYEAHFVTIDQSMPKRTITSIAELNCPLCRESLKDSKRKYISHVAKHMESIALAALPPGPEDLSDDDSNGTEKAALTLTGRSGGLSSTPTSPLPSTYDQTGSGKLYPNTSRIPSARLYATGRSSPVDSGLYTPQQLEHQAFNNFPFPGSEDIPIGQPTFHRDSVNGLSQQSVSVTTGPPFSMFATTADDCFASLPNKPNNLASHVPVSQDSVIFNNTIIDSPPTMWNDSAAFLESQKSFSTAIEECWSVPSLHVMTSAINSPLDYSPGLDSLSPRYVQDFAYSVELPPDATSDMILRKPIGPSQSRVARDLAVRQQRNNGTAETFEEALRFVGRSIREIDNTARDHPLYQNVDPKADGLYHCPWEGQDNCTHKPEKLKCNYDKFVDSHLKPYSCRFFACENSRFSSTAQLLRHEREAHAMHGHGDTPYLCTYEGCERGIAGNGFPRHWNFRDHMKRCHNDPGTTTKSNASRSPPPSNPPTRSKKRKAKATQGSEICPETK